ncbi:TIGR00341 family protein [Halapricum hydrolyticum]|uniref:TIGR00341 family protein n=1 Tax=Halapricum hydrolyticum TaxID=2979991 RepID=A0AAE3LHX3_9EURY|nr:TIGR00341 family protein [Halapricum hydrolyticum]MCU4719144.1 TIGR00341 family protein [Halapricum hydrolyticum]MCU4727334.1 TIGR00341 family protein [Halapricum hydrolyticum]
MRLLQVTIPTGKRRAIERALEDEGVDYVLTDETSNRGYTAVAYVPLPTNAVEPVLEQLRNAGLDDQAYTVIVDANTVISRRFETLQEEYAEEKDEERIARQELTSKAKELAPSTSNYVVLTVVSAVIATAGLLLDSPAVIVGSMVIAPLIGPAMAASVGTVVDDSELFRRGVILQFAGLGLAVASAAVFAWMARTAHLVPPGIEIADVPAIRERLLPDFLSLAVAIGAGIAGVISLSAGVSTALVGVMIAVALIPPAATVGIGIAWGDPWISLPAAVLTLVNVLSINFVALAVLWYRGYRPSEWFDQADARRTTIRRVAVLVAGVAVLSVFLGGITYDSYQRATTEDAIQADVESVLEQRPTATLLDVHVERTEDAIFRDAQRVVVTVGVPPGETEPSLATTLDERLDRRVGHDIETEVRYVGVESVP